MDWIAAALVLISIYMTGEKNRWGWLVGSLGAIMFMIITYKKHIYGMVGLDICLLFLNTINFIKWSKKVKTL